MGAFKTVFTFALLSIAAVVEGTPLSKRAIPDTEYDVLIVGGGPAGLSALSGLSRVRRKSLLIDSGVYRNGFTRHMHDVIGNDGLYPLHSPKKKRNSNTTLQEPSQQTSAQRLANKSTPTQQQPTKTEP